MCDDLINAMTVAYDRLSRMTWPEDDEERAIENAEKIDDAAAILAHALTAYKQH